jgi:hypothetical protein
MVGRNHLQCSVLLSSTRIPTLQIAVNQTTQLFSQHRLRHVPEQKHNCYYSAPQSAPMLSIHQTHAGFYKKQQQQKTLHVRIPI